ADALRCGTQQVELLRPCKERLRCVLRLYLGARAFETMQHFVAHVNAWASLVLAQQTNCVRDGANDPPVAQAQLRAHRECGRARHGLVTTTMAACSASKDRYQIGEDGFPLSLHSCPLSSGKGVGVSPPDVRNRSFDIPGSEGEAVQGFAVWTSAAQILAPSLDKDPCVRLESVLNFSLRRRTEEFERDEGTHNR